MAAAAKPETGLERVGGGGSASPLGRAGELAGDLRGRFSALSSGQRGWLGAGVLLLGAVFSGMWWYANQTDWRILFSGLDSKDVQQISQELSAANIPYQITEDGGGVRVGSDQIDKARMEVATKGMPQTGRMGFELFDKPNWVGSEFDEKVNYQRALEGELEHTIGTLSVVRSARVHLVLPKDALFAGQQTAAKASVVLTLRRSSMPPEQAESIRSLVAGAVENLNVDQVTLVDADGRVNMNGPSKDVAAGDLERGLADKLVAMLEPTAGRDNIRATVNVSYDEASQEKTDEVYDPNQTAPLTVQKSEQTSGQPAKSAGIPGTASNTPGAAAAGSVQAAVAGAGAAADKAAADKAAADKAAADKAAGAIPPLLQAGAKQADVNLPVFPQGPGGQSQSMKQENESYAVTRHMSHWEQGPGQVRRVTAAVIVNDRMGSEGTGKAEHAVWKPRSAEEMKQLEQLARAAVGFDTARGDSLVIENVGFSTNVPEPKPAVIERVLDETGTMLHAQPGLLKTLSFAGIALLLVMVVVRPLTKQMVTTLGQPALLPAGAGLAVRAGGSALGAGNGASHGLGEGEFRREPLKRSHSIHDEVSDYIRKETTQSTKLLETWITAPEEDD